VIGRRSARRDGGIGVMGLRTMIHYAFARPEIAGAVLTVTLIFQAHKANIIAYGGKRGGIPEDCLRAAESLLRMLKRENTSSLLFTNGDHLDIIWQNVLR